MAMTIVLGCRSARCWEGCWCWWSGSGGRRACPGRRTLSWQPSLWPSSGSSPTSRRADWVWLPIRHARPSSAGRSWCTWQTLPSCTGTWSGRRGRTRARYSASSSSPGSTPTTHIYIYSVWAVCHVLPLSASVSERYPSASKLRMPFDGTRISIMRPGRGESRTRFVMW